MIRNRYLEATMVICFSMIISLLAFSTQGMKSGDPGVTGSAVYADLSHDDTLVSGTGFKAIIKGESYNYIFTDENLWFESTDDITWNRAPEMGDTMWKGLYYLQGNGAEIFIGDYKITDLEEFARGWE